MSDHSRTDGDPQLAPAVTLAAAVLLTLATLAVYILLRNEGNTLSGAMLFMLPILTALYAKAGIDASGLSIRRRLDQQDDKLDQQDEVLTVITHQTNGVLTEKINAGVKAALSERDAVVGQQVAAIQAAAAQPAVLAPLAPVEAPAPPE